MKFRPLQDRVLVRRLEQEEKTAGGIIIPDTAKEKPMEGEVVAVGPGARGEDGKLHPLDVKAGDRVLFGKWSGTEVKIDGEELIIMKESDILGVIEGGAVQAQSRLRRFRTMAAKEVKFHGDARERMLRGVDILANAVKVTLGPQGPQRRARQVVRRAAHHQGRRHRRQGDRACRQVREHGRADGARGRLQDQRPAPATAPPRRPCSPRRSCARASRRWPPA